MQDVAVKTIHSRLVSPHVPASEAADNIDRVSAHLPSMTMLLMPHVLFDLFHSSSLHIFDFASERKNRKDKSTPLDVMTGPSVPRSSTRLQLCCLVTSVVLLGDFSCVAW